MKNKDETNAAASKQAIEAKLPYLLQFLANADDDVSGTIAAFAHDYVTMLKQTVPLTDQQKEFVKVQIAQLQVIIAFNHKMALNLCTRFEAFTFWRKVFW